MMYVSVAILACLALLVFGLHRHSNMSPLSQLVEVQLSTGPRALVPSASLIPLTPAGNGAASSAAAARGSSDAASVGQASSMSTSGEFDEQTFPTFTWTPPNGGIIPRFTPMNPPESEPQTEPAWVSEFFGPPNGPKKRRKVDIPQVSESDSTSDA